MHAKSNAKSGEIPIQSLAVWRHMALNVMRGFPPVGCWLAASERLRRADVPCSDPEDENRADDLSARRSWECFPTAANEPQPRESSRP